MAGAPARIASKSSGYLVISISPWRPPVEHPLKYARAALKRLFYAYLLRDFNLASVLMLIGIPLILAGASFGAVKWAHSIRTGELATAGTVMVAALPVVVGLQMILSALNYDISNVPRQPIHTSLIGGDARRPEPHCDGIT